MSPRKLIDVIDDLNEELFHKVGEEEISFSIGTNGACHFVEFGSILLWNSEDDERIFIEENNEYEPMNLFLKRQLIKYSSHLNSIAHKLS